MNGWANWETWNVSLWINGNELLYDVASEVKLCGGTYRHFASIIRRDFGMNSTPDGARWDDPALDIGALDEMFAEI
jgi:hypothetical protein